MNMYSLQATKQLESTFLTLCNYALFVSESLYDRYYKIIVEGQRPIKPEDYGLKADDLTSGIH
jgi:hypothetical protein